VGSDHVYWVITFTVDQMDKFKPIVNKLVAATEKEPGTLAYGAVYQRAGLNGRL
jgi:quinol monooxygenase YgiN